MKKSELYAYIGTFISGIIILLLLLFILLPGLDMEEDGGIMISFGEAFDGGGSTEIPKQQVPQQSAPKPEVKKEELLTQKDKSVVIPKTPTKKVVDNTQSKAEERIKKEQQVTKQADDLIGGSFGSGSPATGSGTNVGDQVAGNPVGSGNEGGNSWSLSGRNLLGKMPTPNYNQNIEGRITVEIRVDASGNVISASVGKNTNISDHSLRDAALNAAKRTRFSTGSGTVAGSIMYNFKLR